MLESKLSLSNRSRRLAEARSRNLRQLLNRAMRCLNSLVEEELSARGYEDIRLAHNTLLIHLDFEGNSISEVADRAQLTKQAMGLLADELEEMGYITRRVDERDARARILMLTDTGQRLMLDMLEIIEEIEERFISLLGVDTLTGLRTGLAAFIGIRQSS